MTFIYPYYENPKFLAAQVERWASYPESLSTWLSFVVVDDGSPNNPAVDVLRRAKAIPERLRLFRVEQDVRWNWIAARNIGAHYADPGEWLLLTDMDHVVDLWTLRTVVVGLHNPKVIYRFGRREYTGDEIHPHPNSWLMTRDMFWRVGGYDEALSGYYGTDGEYRRRCAATAPIVIQKNAVLERHEYVDDSSTTAYRRKQPEDAVVKRIIAHRRPDWKPKVLSFGHHEVLL